MTFTTAVQVAIKVRQMPCGHFVAAIAKRWGSWESRESADYEWVSCSEGHQWHRSEGEVGRLTKELARAQELATAAQTEAATARADAQKARKELDGALTELGNTHRRIQAGVCPYCHRTFQQVQRHMGRKHPERPGVVRLSA